MNDYFVVQEVLGLKFPESLKSYRVMASNRYAVRKPAMHKPARFLAGIVRMLFGGQLCLKLGSLEPLLTIEEIIL